MKPSVNGNRASLPPHRRAALALLATLAIAACGGSDNATTDPALEADSANAAAQVSANGGDAATAVTAVRTTQARATDPRRVRKLIVFGDSLSDVGTYRVGQVAAAGGGMYTTNPGPIWVQTVALVFGTRVTPFKQGGYGELAETKFGTGYAMGGARVALDPGYKCGAVVNGQCTVQLSESLKLQIANHLDRQPAFAPDELVIVQGGPNDIFYELEAVGSGKDPTAAIGAVYQSAIDLVAQLRVLTEHGATRVVVLNAPPMAATPFGKSLDAGGKFVLETMVNTFNATLADELAKAKLPGVVAMNLFDEVNRILAHPRLYLIRNIEGTACDVSVLPGSTSLFCSPQTLVDPLAPYTYMFADGVHPSTITHLNFARFVLAEMWRNRML